MLPNRGRPLIAHVAGTVEKVLGGSGHVAIVGEPDRYRDLGYRVLADLHADCGPLGGILTALSLGESDWNLVVACDMPNLETAHLRKLLDRTLGSGIDCVAGQGPSGQAEPLCAVYHRNCLATLTRALHQGRLKLREILPELDLELVALPASSLANLNTPEEWIAFEERPG